MSSIDNINVGGTGYTIGTTAAKTGSGNAVTNTIPINTKLTDAVGTLLNNDYKLNSDLTANSKHFYFDYQNGKFGYNESSSRGADTFHPFSSSGVLSAVSNCKKYYNLPATTSDLPSGKYIAVFSGFDNTTLTFSGNISATHIVTYHEQSTNTRYYTQVWILNITGSFTITHTGSSYTYAVSFYQVEQSYDVTPYISDIPFTDAISYTDAGLYFITYRSYDCYNDIIDETYFNVTSGSLKDYRSLGGGIAAESRFTVVSYLVEVSANTTMAILNKRSTNVFRETILRIA